MSRTRAADAVMSCCARARFAGVRSGGPAQAVSRPPASSRPAAHGLVLFRSIVHRPTRCKPAHRRQCRRSRLSRPSHPRIPHGHAATRSGPFPPGLVHPLYWYVSRSDAAALFGWSFDPGRDILLCNHIFSLRWVRSP